MSHKPKHAVFIDASSIDFQQDRLFDLSNKHLNRDGTLVPFARLRQRLAELDVAVHTADFLRRGEHLGEVNHYWSLGMVDSYQELINRPDIRFRGFFLLEPPLVAPGMYKRLPELTRRFERVYVHNTHGNGYGLAGVDSAKLAKLYWPQPFNRVAQPYWDRTDRLNKLVVIAGNHNPKLRKPEYYSKRIEAIAALVGQNAIDLYGRGWGKWWSKQSLWPAYWLHRNGVMKAWRGSCESKMEVLSQYKFCLCFENMPMDGYVTEKLFDCLYAGVIPVYMGAANIDSLVDPACYLKIEPDTDWGRLWKQLASMSEETCEQMKQAGKRFVEQDPRFDQYFDFFIDQIADLS